ncbi:protein transporter Sec31 [Streptomyces sp. NPDC088733]|uniref:protein transporter Sec31 n=1 Tax=Streptomyces sp. NPDC088733 TaxID=3365880 RepID=UPI00381E3E36
MKTRRVRRERLVPHTVDGQEELVREAYWTDAPVPPRDWDRIILAAVTAIAALLLGVAVVWSTASIGDLLARVTVTPAAYAAAVAFDLAWIVCMAVEWLARYDPAGARRPRIAGHLALVVAMVAVGTHGWLAGQAAIGVIGAAVSGIVKGLWTVVLSRHAKPLDGRTQQWVDIQRARVGGQLAMVPIRRELQRAQGAVDAEAAALGAADPDRNPDVDPRESGDPDADVVPIANGPMTVRDAVRTALDCGIQEPDAVLRYVHKVANANAKQETVDRYLRGLRRSG